MDEDLSPLHQHMRALYERVLSGSFIIHSRSSVLFRFIHVPFLCFFAWFSFVLSKIFLCGIKVWVSGTAEQKDPSGFSLGK